MRLAAAALIALAGLRFATESGAPILAALVAFVAGTVALALWFAPSAAEDPEERPVQMAAASILPKASDVVNAVEDPVLIVRERRVLLANPAAKALLGDHIEGVDVRLAIRHPATADALIGEPATHERIEIVGLGDQDRRWEMRVSPLVDGSRLVRLTDRSDVHASEKMRVDFVANASHELRTPLATLIGFSETLLDDADASGDPKTRKRFLKIMADEALRMQQLVDDLISLSRIEAERFSVPREPVALLPLVEQVRGETARLLDEKKSRIAIEPVAAEPVAAGDSPQLLQLIRNLVVNAIKYGRTGDDIIVRFEKADEDMLRLSVIDHGDGIAPEHLPRLTERFYRVDPSRSRAIGGTGLGLAIVKHIVGRHRGRLDIQSQVGEGTRVDVYLPRAEPALSSKSHESVTEVTRNRSSDDPGSE
jgi:two-component system phosphate regulon sensor histidine kinase PhoR